jgi:hypothetical protein
MITNSPFVQLFMVVLALAILFLYIRPTVTEIRATQDNISAYENELDRVTNVNDLLRSHTSAIDALPLSNIQALERYLPSQVDEIAIMRDLELIVNEVGVQLVTLEFAGSDANVSADPSLEVTSRGNNPIATKFHLGVTSSYDELKTLLSAIEINNYQLSIDSADITPTEDGKLNADIVLVAYSLDAVPTE